MRHGQSFNTVSSTGPSSLFELALTLHLIKDKLG